MAAIDIAALRGAIGGDVIAPADGGYDAARAVWNATIDRRPAAIVRCTGTDDVVAGLAFARDSGVRVSVRGGGHNIAGLAVCDGGIVLDLSGLRGAAVDVDARVAHVQPGSTWGDVDSATQAHGLAAPGGIVSTTGVAGFTLGGGIGWLTRPYGPACDSLVGAEVVTADGAVVEADGDLLWGLRGGGGNFGVVTRFDLRLHPVGPHVLAGPIAFQLSRLPAVLDMFHTLAAADHPELTMLLMLRRLSSAEWVPAAVRGVPSALLHFCWAGDIAAGRRALAGLQTLGPPLASALGRKRYVAWQSFSDAAWLPGLHNYWKSEYLARVDDVAALEASTLAVPTALSDIKVWHLGGAFARPQEDAAAFAHRSSPFMLNVNARWERPAEAERNVTWARDVWTALQPSSAGGVYVNFLGEEGADRVRAAYGDAKYARLAQLKRRYDPENVFRVNQNIVPASGAGRFDRAQLDRGALGRG
ncbi:FAD-binding oxidoreductase [Solirubrobacter soli]|uniref:FAD-binding oxidoreductase n=1 Tax=Solirubrobacter soli TaxID=363832 RepID=UPI00069FAF46|nr:FAD-binding oxidoreductase [Solirubrobacter soli]